jgi:hypothetical protein
MPGFQELFGNGEHNGFWIFAPGAKGKIDQLMAAKPKRARMGGEFTGTGTLLLVNGRIAVNEFHETFVRSGAYNRSGPACVWHSLPPRSYFS